MDIGERAWNMIGDILPRLAAIEKRLDMPRKRKAWVNTAPGCSDWTWNEQLADEWRVKCYTVQEVMLDVQP